MKKLILTETQIEKLKSHLLTEDENREGKLKEFVKSIKEEFITSVGKHNIGNYITFAFGDVDKDGKWESDGLRLITFRIVDVTEYGAIELEFVTNEGPKTALNNVPEDTKIVLYSKGTKGFHFAKQTPSVGFDIGEDLIIIPNFIAYIITEKETKTTAIEASKKAQEKWMVANEKFNKAMVYEPSFLGMDNFFFFPKGYMAMDKVLDKFGLSVSEVNRVKIKIRNGDIKGDEETLRKNGEYSGILKNNRIIIQSNDEDFIFYGGKNKLVRDGNFVLNVSYKKQGGDETPVGEHEIKILKI
jgi:hypothetical protein